MVIGDGILTPSISVLSAVSGIKESAKSLNQNSIVAISVVILILLFAVQRFGTDKVGYSFAPIILLWFCFIGLTGIYNLFKHDVGVLRALNPKYIIDYFRRNGRQAWISLGGVILSITGTEAMFADLGHFSVRSIQIGFTTTVFPSIISAYLGQSAYLRKHPDDVNDAFFKSIPYSLYWPTFILAVAAAIIASQALISGAFAIITQSLTLGCFPRVKVVHTSAKYEGQVYIPEINYMLMVACVIVTVSFKTTTNIGNAYGIAVVAVMVITTFMTTLIMLMIWKTSIWLVALFFLVFGTVELIYLSSVLYKFKQGGFLPLAFSFFLVMIMGIWHYVHKERYIFELKNKVSDGYMKDLATNPNINRIPGMGLLYSELVQGIPPIFPHFIENIPSIHSVLVFVSIKPIPISKVALEERFLFRQVEPREYRMFRCVVRCGYNDLLGEPKEFEHHLADYLKEFIHHQHFFLESVPNEPDVSKCEPKGAKPRGSGCSTVHIEETLQKQNSARISSGSINRVTSQSPNASSRIISGPIQETEEEIEFIQKAMDEGVVYLLGETGVVADKGSSLFKRIVVNYVYSFLRRNFRQADKILSIPHSKLLKVGMIYEI